MQGRWPTPTAMDCHVAENLETWGNRVNRTDYCHIPLRLLAKAMEVVPGPGHLNPVWVEWLMGYPINWTDCTD